MFIDDILGGDYNINFDGFLARVEDESGLALEDTFLERVKPVCLSMRDLLFYNDSIMPLRKKILMASTLFHEIGNFMRIKGNEINKPGLMGYESCSEKIARSVLWDNDFYVREDICSLIRNHTQPLRLYNAINKRRKVMLLSHDVTTIKELLLFSGLVCGWGNKNDDELDLKLGNMIKYAKRLDCFDHPFNFYNGYTKFYFFNYDMRAKYPTIMSNDKSFDVYMMVGLPGAGKNTYINDKLSCFPVVSRDDIRSGFGTSGNKTVFSDKREKEISRIENEMILDLAKKRQSFIINNINLKRKYRQHYLGILRDYNPNVHIIYIQAPLFSDNIKRRENMIRKDVMVRMKYSFDFPLPDEYVTFKAIVR